jgi:hypothetical protein
MSRFRKTSILALGIFISSVFLGISLPAVASTQQLPSGQSIVTIPCEPSPSTLYEFDLTSDSVSSIGTAPISSGVCIGSSVLDPNSEELITFDFQENNWVPTGLIRLDPATGETLGRINLVIDEAADSPDAGIVPLSGLGGYLIDSISMDSLGNLFVFLDDHKLYYASPTQTANTFELRFLINTPRYALASASDPTDPGSIYALFQDNSGGNDRFYKFSISYAGSIPQSATMGSAISSQCDYSCWAISFDESGVAWIQKSRTDNANQPVYEIFTTSFENSNPSYTFQAALPWEFYSLTVVPTAVLTASNSAAVPAAIPALANTGTNSALLALAGLITSSAGIALALLVRLRLFKIQ